MDNFSFEILNALKEKYEKVRPQIKYQVTEKGKEYSARQFYTADLVDNLFKPMSEKTYGDYVQGSGNELGDKMKALRSSSAMTYNLFEDDIFECLGNNNFESGLYSTKFEEQFRTLNSSVSGKPANLDVLLTQEKTGEIIACEMKMAEWIFNKPCKLKSAYLEKPNYQFEDNADIFIEVAKSLIDQNNDKMAEKEYVPITAQYDAFQMFKHTLACYNACRNGEIKTDKLTLLNVVWEMEDLSSLSDKTAEKYKKLLENEHNEFDVFYSKIAPIKELFKTIGVKFDICYYSVSKFLSISKLSNKHKNYLTRYEI